MLPAIGPAIAGGTLAAILSSAAAGAATAGVAGALIGLGIPEEEANYYDQEFRAGRTVVTVQAPGRQTEARSILQQGGNRSMAAGASAAAAMPAAARDGRAAPRPARALLLRGQRGRADDDISRLVTRFASFVARYK